jgi:hypothetical protein
MEYFIVARDSVPAMNWEKAREKEAMLNVKSTYKNSLK